MEDRYGHVQLDISHDAFGTRTAAAGSALPSMVLSRLGIKVAALEAQLTNAQAEKDAAAKRAEEQKQALERVEAELLAMRTSARQAASSANDRVRSLAHEAAAAADAASELKRQLAERQEMIESLLDGRERSVAQASIQLSALERQLAGKESERASLANSLRSQGVLVDALESELATVRQQVESVRAAQSSTSAALSAHSAWLAGCVVDGEALLLQVEQARAHAEEMQERCRGAESRAVQAAGDVLEVRAALAAAQACLADTQAALQQRDSHLADATAHTTALSQALARSESALAASAAARAALEGRLAALHGEIQARYDVDAARMHALARSVEDARVAAERAAAGVPILTPTAVIAPVASGPPRHTSSVGMAKTPVGKATAALAVTSSGGSGGRGSRGGGVRAAAGSVSVSTSSATASPAGDSIAAAYGSGAVGSFTSQGCASDVKHTSAMAPAGIHSQDQAGSVVQAVDTGQQQQPQSPASATGQAAKLDTLSAPPATGAVPAGSPAAVPAGADTSVEKASKAHVPRVHVTGRGSAADPTADQAGAGGRHEAPASKPADDDVETHTEAGATGATTAPNTVCNPEPTPDPVSHGATEHTAGQNIKTMLHADGDVCMGMSSNVAAPAAAIVEQFGRMVTEPDVQAGAMAPAVTNRKPADTARANVELFEVATLTRVGVLADGPLTEGIKINCEQCCASELELGHCQVEWQPRQEPDKAAGEGCGDGGEVDRGGGDEPAVKRQRCGGADDTPAADIGVKVGGRMDSEAMQPLVSEQAEMVAGHEHIREDAVVMEDACTAYALGSESVDGLALVLVTAGKAKAGAGAKDAPSLGQGKQDNMDVISFMGDPLLNTAAAALPVAGDGSALGMLPLTEADPAGTQVSTVINEANTVENITSSDVPDAKGTDTTNPAAVYASSSMHGCGTTTATAAVVTSASFKDLGVCMAAELSAKDAALSPLPAPASGAAMQAAVDAPAAAALLPASDAHAVGDAQAVALAAVSAAGAEEPDRSTSRESPTAPNVQTNHIRPIIRTPPAIASIPTGCSTGREIGGSYADVGTVGAGLGHAGAVQMAAGAGPSVTGVGSVVSSGVGVVTGGCMGLSGAGSTPVKKPHVLLPPLHRPKGHPGSSSSAIPCSPSSKLLQARTTAMQAMPPPAGMQLASGSRRGLQLGSGGGGGLRSMTGLPALAPSLQERTETGMLLPYSTASAVTDIEAAGAVIMPAPVPASSVMQPAVPGSAGYDAHGSVQLQAPAPLLGGLFAALDNCWDG